MITLITGTPGAGKTAWMVELLRKLDGNRPMYVAGLDGLQLPHQPLADPHQWHNDVPDGSVVVIDEVQEVWRARAAGSKVPDHIAALETHRHKGLDFYITTHGPQRVDSNVRALVGRHIHLRDAGVLGRHLYEWPECCDTARTTGWKTAPIKHAYRLPKEAFALYKSASIHVKPVRGFPRVLAVLACALVLLVASVWFAYHSISQKMHPPALVPTGAGSTLTAQILPARYLPPQKVLTAPDERVDFIPALPNRPWTAPAYDTLRKVAVLPLITGALCVDDRCRCYSGEQRLPDVTSEACSSWLKNKPFNPYASATGTDAANSRIASGSGAEPSAINVSSSASVPGAVR